ANWFSWSPDRSHVAGQMWEGDFWIWDFRTKMFVNLPLRKEGEWRVIEDWGPDGTILFTSWTNRYAYWGRTPRLEGLYQLNPKTGLTKMIAKNGVMATASDVAVSYVELGASPRLVVKRWSGTTLWTEKLGVVSKEWLGQVRSYRPKFVGPFLSYRHTNGDWFVSRTDELSPRRVAGGRDTRVSWRPDGHYAAIHQGGQLSVLLNPLVSQVQER
ncbi:MAG: hypothetical protein K0R39_3985, partial [Symbiobacteriaceae bacterium]|nr:hypothetical protein [Symbiobacteriaceae bacterium]